MCGNIAKHGNNDQVKHLIFVQCIGGSNARILLYEKGWSGDDDWKILLACPGYIGRNGYTTGWKREGDGKTPCGNFGIMGAFGIKENPGTGLNYLRVLDEFYWCDEPGMYYNRLVSIREVP